MIILAIDTSCDDTSIAILKIGNRKLEILSNIVSSQVKVHQKYGGVYPTLAKREHQRNLPIVLKKALKEAGFEIFNFTTPLPPPSRLRRAPSFSIFKQIPKSKIPNINFIAVTVGPGLEPCLWVGVNFAKDLAQQWNLPIIPVNHIEGHILANFLPKVSSNFQFHYTTGGIGLSTLPPSAGPSFFNFQKTFPAICLIVSGGHTQLILMTPVRKASLSNRGGKNWKYKIIGETRDDAAGECLDKTARILGLGYPGGPAIAALAESFKFQASSFKIKLPRPMINSKNYDFSFSGLKTAVLYDFKKRPEKIRRSKKYIGEMAKEIQQAIIDVLIKKTIRAAKNYKTKSIILGGGVTANNQLRRQFQLKIKNLKLKINFLVPPKNLCTDNAAMIGVAGYFNQKKSTKNWRKIKVNANQRI